MDVLEPTEEHTFIRSAVERPVITTSEKWTDGSQDERKEPQESDHWEEELVIEATTKDSGCREDSNSQSEAGLCDIRKLDEDGLSSADYRRVQVTKIIARDGPMKR